MFIHLKRGEKLYVNGAVLRVDRRTSLEFLNNVTFLLENHVMQPDEATTPLKELYFVTQTMLMDPANAHMTLEVYKHLSHRARQSVTDNKVTEQIDLADQKIASGRYFDALRYLRNCFDEEKHVAIPSSNAEEAA
ncbi:flagellar biosynthesis repressor FlbT [Aestuariivirga sp.]|jgi:flagellar protein FlbT|uniref:flagellar biosynthesis repressor FlbT n=1 Tax=Aestuariivirga sp. TaxID=2650926 RepID=UPI0037843010